MRRRDFLKCAGGGALTLGLPGIGWAATPSFRPAKANDDVRLAVVGIGSAEAKGGVGGRGRQLIDALQKVQGARIVALCDLDERILARQAGELKDRGLAVAVYRDLRRVFESKEVDAVTRSRKVVDLHADVLQGHLSAACCHLVNISHRLGQTAAPDVVAERAKSDPLLSDAITRYHEHLHAHQIDFARTEILGPGLAFDAQPGRFTGEFADPANSLLRRAYRSPFVVPDIAG